MNTRCRTQTLTALALLAILLFASSAHPFAAGQAVVASTDVGGTSYGLAYDSAKGEVFDTHFFNDSVTVLSDSNGAVVSTIQFGVNYEPIGIAYDSSKGEMFVANYGANTVSVISDATDKVLTNVSVGAYPYAVAYDSAKNEIFVAGGGRSSAGSVYVISDATNSVVATIPVGFNPQSLAYDPGTGDVYVACSGADAVSVISDSSNTVIATVTVGSSPSGVAYDSGKGEIFVANYGGDTVSVVSDTTNAVVATIGGVLGPWGVAYDPATGEVFVADDGNLTTTATDVSVISDTTNAITTNVNTGFANTVLAYDPTKAEIFVGGDNDHFVTIISDTAVATSTSTATGQTSSATTQTGTSASSCFSSGSIGAQLSVSCTSFTYNTGTAQGGPGTVGVGEYPLGLAYDPATGQVFVAEFSAPAVAAISDSTDAVVNTVEIPGLNNPGFSESPSPQYIAYDSGKGEIFVSNLYGNCVTVISTSTDSVVATIDLGNDSENGGIGVYPTTLAYDPAMGEIFVVDQGLSTIVGSYSASAGAVSVISDATNTVVATVPMGDFPSAIAYDSAKGEMFVTEDGRIPSDTSASNTGTGIVSVISDATNVVVSAISVGPFPDGIAYDSAKGEMFVASDGNTTVAGSVSVISDSSNTVTTAIPLKDAGTVAYDSGKGEVFVVTPSSNSTAVISDATNAVVQTLPSGPGPFYIVYDSAKGELFVSNPTNDTVTILSDAGPAASSTTSSSSKSSSIALGPSYLALFAANAAVLLLLGAAMWKTGRRSTPNRLGAGNA